MGVNLAQKQCNVWELVSGEIDKIEEVLHCGHDGGMCAMECECLE